MEPATIIAIATAVLTVLKPYLPKIAEKAAEKIGSELPVAVGKLWTALKGKFETRPSAKEALVDLLKDPEDADLQAAFRVQLKKALEEDKDFAEQVKRLLEEAGAQIRVQVRDGAAAIGDHAKAVGKSGILVEGDVGGDILGSGAKKSEK